MRFWTRVAAVLMCCELVTCCSSPPPESSSAAGNSGSKDSSQASPSEQSRTSEVAGSPAAALTTTPAPTGSGRPPFQATVKQIDNALADRMSTSWRPGCPVPLAQLRYLQMTYLGFDGLSHLGEMVVSVDVVPSVIRVFAALYAADYPITSMRLVDDFGADDEASMAANNSSAFNCRPKTGGGAWSNHSFGRAIDLNPVENPYVSGSTVLPPAGAAYLNRDALTPGLIRAGDVVVSAFAAEGWQWGGSWSDPIDYQHFEIA